MFHFGNFHTHMGWRCWHWSGHDLGIQLHNPQKKCTPRTLEMGVESPKHVGMPHDPGAWVSSLFHGCCYHHHYVHQMISAVTNCHPWCGQTHMPPHPDVARCHTKVIVFWPGWGWQKLHKWPRIANQHPKFSRKQRSTNDDGPSEFQICLVASEKADTPFLVRYLACRKAILGHHKVVCRHPAEVLSFPNKCVFEE
jgi:hypothetical protein